MRGLVMGYKRNREKVYKKENKDNYDIQSANLEGD